MIGEHYQPGWPLNVKQAYYDGMFDAFRMWLAAFTGVLGPIADADLAKIKEHVERESFRNTIKAQQEVKP